MAQLTGRLRDKALVGWFTPLPQAKHSWQADALMAIDVAGVDREHRCDRLEMVNLSLARGWHPTRFASVCARRVVTY